MKVVHLPFYDDNPYQTLLMDALRKEGVETLPGGGGGNFLRTAMFKWKADVLHFHWLHPYLIRRSRRGTILRATRFLAEVLILKALGKKIVWTAHNLKNHDNQHVSLDKWFTKQFTRLADAIITHSVTAQTLLVESLRPPESSNIYVVPHGNYIECYPNTVSRADARRKLNIDKAYYTFLFFGRIQPYKGVLKLIEKFKTISRPAQLVIAGKAANDSHVPLIRAAIGGCKNIMFHPGYVSENDIQYYMNACDVVVLPYEEVLTSGTAVLAMSFGKPAIAPRIGCLPEIFSGSGAIFYDLLHPEELKLVLERAVTEANKLRDMGKRNYDQALKWTWPSIAEEHKRIYELALL